VARLLEVGASEDVPIERLVQALLADAVHAGATDLHVEPDGPVTRVRHRVDGLLRGAENLPRELTLPVVTRFKILAGLDIAERRRAQDGRIRLVLDEREIDLRLSVLPCADGENAGRAHPRPARALALALRAPARARPRRARSSAWPRGRRACSWSADRPARARPPRCSRCSRAWTRWRATVVTIEDPIEYRLPLLRQTQVDPAVGLDFGSGLRSLLRQDRT
jgi:type II secretory ATPase GspE/PulE/Tfp pilus assembly ATPase PilB-like protein